MASKFNYPTKSKAPATPAMTKKATMSKMEDPIRSIPKGETITPMPDRSIPKMPNGTISKPTPLTKDMTKRATPKSMMNMKFKPIAKATPKSTKGYK